MGLTNDERGWILTGISALACVLGASVICVDVIIRLFPGKKGFRIQDSNGFLSCSLSLSAGVMLFSSLYRMLPESKEYLELAGYTPKEAAWIVIASFLAGVFGIQILSRIFHTFMPSQVVDCDHTHDDDENQSPEEAKDHANHSHHRHSSGHGSGQAGQSLPRPNGHTPSESTPLLARTDSQEELPSRHTTSQDLGDRGRRASPLELGTWKKLKPSLQVRMTNTVSQIMSGPKAQCDEEGPCHGYSDPCGQDCFKNIQAKGGTRIPSFSSATSTRISLSRNATAIAASDFQTLAQRPPTSAAFRQLSDSIVPRPRTSASTHKPSLLSHSPTSSRSPSPPQTASRTHTLTTVPTATAAPAHHHHVPANAFLSIGMQTSFAIALHKLPEGFITYATNHANPSLGFTVFLSLFLHNISEGFALALPLYLALSSRAKALLVSFALGGLSQPLGAAVAAIWLKIAERGRGADEALSDGAYGGMFAATAGVLACVALGLLQEAFELSHGKQLCLAFVFIGMGVLGVSSALTA